MMRTLLLATAALAAASLPIASPALAAHTRSSDPVAMVVPQHVLIPCAGQDVAPAVNAAWAAGTQIVTLGAGQCLASASLTPTNNAVLDGQGIGATVVRAATANAYPLVTIGGGTQATGVTGAQVRYLTLDGAATALNASATTHADGVIVTSSSARINLQNIEVMNAGDNGVRIAGSYVTLNASFVHANWKNGVFVQGVAQPGLAIHWADHDTIEGSRVSWNSRGRAPGSKKVTGLPAWDGICTDQVVSSALIQGNVVEGDDILMFDTRTGGVTSPGGQVIGNTVQHSLQTGIDIGNESGFVVSGNALLDDLDWSIDVGGVSSGSLVNNTATGGGPIVVHKGSTVTSSGNVLH